MEMKPVDLYFEERGEGIPIIFLHGFPFDHSIWEPVASQLCDEARLILPDLRGFGQSPVPEGTYSMRVQAEDIAALMNRLNIEKAVLVGHSMGGYIALAFAKAYPHRLLGLGLVATHAAADNPERRQARYKTAEAVDHKGARVVASDMVNTLTRRKELVKAVEEMILRAHPHGIGGALRGMAERPDMTGSLSRIQVPAVVIAGDADQLLPMERPEEMAQMLPKGWLVTVPGGGHMLMMEEPQLVADSLRQVFRRVDGYGNNHQA